MEYFLIIGSLVLPGMFLPVLFFRQSHLAPQNSAIQSLSFFFSSSFVTSLSLWVFVSQISYLFVLPLYIGTVIIGVLCAFSIVTLILNFSFCKFATHEFFEILILFFLGILIGLPFAFQTSLSDAFWHLSQIRAVTENHYAITYNGVLGEGTLMQQNYVNNPLHFLAGSILKFIKVSMGNGALALNLSLSALSLITLNSTSKLLMNRNTQKSLIIVCITLIGILAGDINDWKGFAYLFVSFGFLIFPYHLIAFAILPFFVVLLIYYQINKNIFILALLFAALVCVARMHGAISFWVPWFALSVFILFLGKRVFSIKAILQNQHFFALGAVYVLLISSFYWDEGYRIWIEPYGLWQNSGVDWINLGNGFVLYSPAELLKYFWLPCLIFTLYFFIIRMRSLRETAWREQNILFVYTLRLLFLVTILFSLNPIFTKVMIELSSTSVQFYRYKFVIQTLTFSLTGILMLSLFQYLKERSRVFGVLGVGGAAIVLLGWLYFVQDFITCTYKNCGNYINLVASPADEPYSLLLSLPKGKIALSDVSLSPSIAAFTELNPIVTESWRDISAKKYRERTKVNSELVANHLNPVQLEKMMQQASVSYILLSSDKMIDAQSKITDLVKIAETESYQVWKVALW